MELLKGWEKPIKAAKKPANQGFRLPKYPDYYSRKVNYVYTRSGGKAMVELASQRPLSHIGMAFLYRNGHNPRDIEPLLLSLSMAEPGKAGKKGVLYRFVVDLRRPKVIPFLREIFALPVCFVGHNLKNDFFCLWKLNLEPPRNIWDSFICEEALDLGLYHWKYTVNRGMELPREIRAKEEIKERQAVQHSLESISQRHGIPCGGNQPKAFLNRLFKQDKWRPLTQEEVNTAAEKASLTGKLYFYQVQQAALQGILNHLVGIEMPYLKTNAEIEWQGVRIDPKRQARTIKAGKRYSQKLKKTLAKYGLSAPPDDQELKKLFKKAGILRNFQDDGGLSFEKAILKKNKAFHPAIPVILAWNRLTSILNDKILKGSHQSSNGRIYPQYQQLGTHTGRVTSKHPSIMSLDSLLRPLIIPGEGRLIGEADWSQIEIGILAALYQDSNLIAMFNSGDVYSEMAKVFYRKGIEKADLGLPRKKFKKKYGKQRQIMKTCILGIIYGMTPKSLGESLNCSMEEAQGLYQDVIMMMSKFQVIQAGVDWSAIRGYASTASNLHRHRGKSGKTEPWEKRWLLNHPVQGTGAALFKATANRLNLLYRSLDAKIMVPLHDSFVFSAPERNFKKVAKLTKRVMRETVQEFFPELQPRVEINISRPDCWNKDGDGNLFRKWIKTLDKLIADAV